MSNNHEIDVRVFLKILLKRKKNIAIGVVILSLFASIVIYLLPNVYQRDVVLSTYSMKTKKSIITNVEDLKDIISNTDIKGISIPAYRNFYSIFANRELFALYINKSGFDEAWLIHPDFFDKSAIPIYSYEVSNQEVNNNNSVLGIRVICDAKTPEQAKAKAESLATYLKYVILNIQIWNFVDANANKLNNEISYSLKSIILLEINNNTLKEKEDLLVNDILKSPLTNRYFESQITSIDSVTEKYLSPQQQLVSVKVEIKDNESLIKELNRKILITKIVLEFFNKISVDFFIGKYFLVDELLLQNIKKAKEGFFITVEKSNEKNVALLTINEFFSAFQGINAEYKIVPNVPLGLSPIKHNKYFLFTISVLVSLVVCVVYVLSAEWWSRV